VSVLGFLCLSVGKGRLRLFVELFSRSLLSSARHDIGIFSVFCRVFRVDESGRFLGSDEAPILQNLSRAKSCRLRRSQGCPWNYEMSGYGQYVQHVMDC